MLDIPSPLRTTLHIVYNDIGYRAQLARLALAAGHHAEIYDSIEELVTQASQGGVVLAHDNPPNGGVASMIAALVKAGSWRPVIAFSEQTEISAVVDAIKAGANDYINRPEEIGPLNQAIARALLTAQAQGPLRARASEARRRITLLTLREREVLERLAGGGSNKAIARDLGLSPRTVEIHRMKMMGKMSARHSTDAVRMWIEAEGLDAA